MLHILSVIALFGYNGYPDIRDMFLKSFNAKVVVTMTHPPSLRLDIQRVAIKGAGGPCVDEVLTDLADQFLDNGVEVLDRANTETILSEIDFGASGYVNRDTALHLGELLQADALVLVKGHYCKTEHRRDSNSYTDKKGVRHTTYRVYTDGHFKVGVQIIDFMTGRLYESEIVEGRSIASNSSSDGYPSYPSKVDARNRAIADGMARLARMFFSWQERREFVFFDNKKLGLREAANLVRIGEYREALARARISADTAETSPKVKSKLKARARYNLGMCHFILGEHDQALTHLTRAYQISSTKVFREAVLECKRSKQLAEQVSAALDLRRGAEREGGGRDPNR